MTEKQDMGVVTQDDEIFCDVIWQAFKGDHNDLRKQQMILKAHRLASQAEQRKIADRIASIVEDRIRSEFKGFWTAEDLVEEIPTMIREAAAHPQPSQKGEGDE